MYKYIIKDIPPSNNKYLGNSNSFRIYNKDKKRWFLYMLNAIKENIPQRPITLANVTITYYFKDKTRRDPDNYSGKFILDPLVALKVLKDDSFNVIDTLKIKGFIDRVNPRVEIVIFPLEMED